MFHISQMIGMAFAAGATVAFLLSFLMASPKAAKRTRIISVIVFLVAPIASILLIP
jgi:hypothetical protein